MPPPNDRELLVSEEDQKIVTLARATRARTGAAQGAAVRDLDGRTYTAATVTLPSLSISALALAVAMAASSGAEEIERAALVTDAESFDGPVAGDDDLAVLRGLGPRAALFVADPGGVARGVVVPRPDPS